VSGSVPPSCFLCVLDKRDKRVKWRQRDERDDVQSLVDAVGSVMAPAMGFPWEPKDIGRPLKGKGRGGKPAFDPNADREPVGLGGVYPAASAVARGRGAGRGVRRAIDVASAAAATRGASKRPGQKTPAPPPSPAPGFSPSSAGASSSTATP